MVETLCTILDKLKPKLDGKSYANQITYVKDRPGHDRRYAIDASKLEHLSNSATILLNIWSRAAIITWKFFVGSFVGRRGSQNPQIID